jgi:PAS domain S-box-containing protein
MRPPGLDASRRRGRTTVTEPVEHEVARRDDRLRLALERARPGAPATPGTDEAVRFQAQLLDAVEQAVIATDLRGRVVYWNRFAETLYGWPAEEAVGRDLRDLIAADTSGEEARAIIDSVARGENWRGEFEVCRKDGAWFLAHILATPVLDGGVSWASSGSRSTSPSECWPSAG